jgi:2,3-bisphosphoglycerate-independent phosphoglycerate mutase
MPEVPPGQGPPHERVLLVILDGVGDRPRPRGSPNPTTPLEEARTPYLDWLAAQGTLGSVRVIAPGIAPESDAGVLSLLGYDPEEDSPGRGVLEAEGIGLSVRRGEVAFRCNFATVSAEGVVVDQRVGRNLTTEEAQSLAETLTQANLLRDRGVDAVVRATVGHRGVVHLIPRGSSRLSAHVSNSDPFYEKIGGLGQALRPEKPVPRPVKPLEDTPEAALTAELTNLFLDRVPAVLRDHPVNQARRRRGALEANHILLRDAGTLPERRVPFEDKYGLRGAAVTEMPVERGIARYLGLRDRYVGPMRGDRQGAFRDRAQEVTAALEEDPFVYVHLKGPDEPGHDGDFGRKKAVIEDIDAGFFGTLRETLDLTRTRVAVTADHATPWALKGHSDDPVPLLLVGGLGTREPSAPVKFCERDAGQGSLGEIRGRDLLPILLGPDFPRARRP